MTAVAPTFSEQISILKQSEDRQARIEYRQLVVEAATKGQPVEQGLLERLIELGDRLGYHAKTINSEQYLGVLGQFVSAIPALVETGSRAAVLMLGGMKLTERTPGSAATSCSSRR